MPAAIARALGRLVTANNQRIAAVDPVRDNPRDLTSSPWHHRLAARTPELRAEWDRFVGEGGRLPAIEDVLGEHQGNEGPWRMGLLVHRGHTTELGRRRFPATLDALAAIPGLAAALWSVIEPGTELTPHRGPNAGVLRYHLGVDCPEGAALEIDGVVVPYREGEGILFDDTALHGAWNHGDRRRVTLFCEIERPLPPAARLRNRLVQRVVALDTRGRGLPDRADEWHWALNP